jgi:hypothetical protein
MIFWTFGSRRVFEFGRLCSHVNVEREER